MISTHMDDQHNMMHAGRLMATIYLRVAPEVDAKMLAADLNDYTRNRKREIEQDSLNDQHPTDHV